MCFGFGLPGVNGFVLSPPLLFPTRRCRADQGRALQCRRDGVHGEHSPSPSSPLQTFCLWVPSPVSTLGGLPSHLVMLCSHQYMVVVSHA